MYTAQKVSVSTWAEYMDHFFIFSDLYCSMAFEVECYIGIFLFFLLAVQETRCPTI